MGDSKRKTWLLGTALAGLVLAAASWFLAISPTYATAEATRAEVQSTRDQNELLELRIARLRADSERLPEYREDLASLSRQIPTEAELASYLRQIDAAAVARTVTLTAVSPSPAITVVPAAPATPTAPAAEQTVPEQAVPEQATPAQPVPDGTGAEVTAAPVTAAAPDGFVAIPVSLTVVGSYGNALGFLDDVQTGIERLFLVTGLQITALEASAAGGGRPATSAGDLELVLSGFAYVLSAPDDTIAEPGEVAPLPVPLAGRNPLVPIGG